jgi:Type II secretion system (T2SS), protein M subtype b
VTWSISPPFRRTLALAILALVCLFAWSLLIEPLIDLSRDRQSDIRALSEQLDRLEAVIARKPELELRAGSLQAQLAAAGGFWDGASPAAIAAGIQDRLRTAVSGSGGRVKSTSEGNEAADHGFRKVTVRFGIEGTIETVQQTLSAVTAAAPALFVDGFTVTAPTNEAMRDHPPVLNLDLNVAGYMRGSPS